MSAYERIVLNPVEFVPELPEIDLFAAGIAIAEPGPNYGEASVTVERIKKAIGEGAISPHWPSVDCEVPLLVSSDPAVTQANAFKPIEAFVAEVQRRSRGWVRREFADAAGFSGSVGAFIDAAALTTPKGRGRIDQITLKFSRHPFWFATVEEESEEFSASEVRELEFTLAEMLGTVPGLIKVVVKNNGSEDWRGCILSLECDDYSDAETAKPHYRAKDLTLQGGSEVVEDEAGDEVVKCPALTSGWVTVLSSKIGEETHMTHVGPRRMIFRLEDPSEKTDAQRLAEWAAAGGEASGVTKPALRQVQWKLEWRALGSANWVQTMEGSTPIVRVSGAVGDYQLLDLGAVRPERATTGDQRWECRLQAKVPPAAPQGTLRPLIRDVYPMSTEQWMRVADTSDNPIDGEPAALGGTVENATGVGTVAWKAKSGSGTMSFAEESKYPTIASMSAATNYLKVTNFGFGSLIPSGADIRGVIARAVPSEAGGSIEEKRVRLVIEGAIKETEDKATPGGGSAWYWSSPLPRSWGGVQDLWGQTSITRAQVVASNFGWALALGGPTFEVGETRKISFKRIEMIVAYSEGGDENRVCFAGRAVEFSDNGVRRQHITDDVLGELVEDGFLPYAPAPGQAGQPMRGILIPSIGDFAERADSAAVKLSAKVTYRPTFLFASEAS